MTYHIDFQALLDYLTDRFGPAAGGVIFRHEVDYVQQCDDSDEQLIEYFSDPKTIASQYKVVKPDYFDDLYESIVTGRLIIPVLETGDIVTTDDENDEVYL